MRKALVSALRTQFLPTEMKNVAASQLLSRAVLVTVACADSGETELLPVAIWVCVFLDTDCKPCAGAC